jgi:hypothetical protein
MTKWEYAQLQVWDQVSGKTVGLGYPARNRLAFLVGPYGEQDLPSNLGWLELYNMLGREGWEFISSSYQSEGNHQCGRHGILKHFATFTTFKRQAA